jgi:uncharacterized membrane protein YkvA (DUF1232 family)
MEGWQARAKALKRESLAVYLACKDRRTPWYAKLLAAGVVAYLFSPIDLIPDPIPVLGYLDDLVLVPLGIAAALRLIPGEVMADARLAAERADGRPTTRAAAAFILAIWLLAALFMVQAAMLLVRR